MFQTLPGLLTGFFPSTHRGGDVICNLFQTLPGLLTGFFDGRDRAMELDRNDVSNPSRASYRFLQLGLNHLAKDTLKFQTLPGLLTGFFAGVRTGGTYVGKSFKPFQGFLPVSSSPSKNWLRAL